MMPVSPVMPGSEPIEIVLAKNQSEYIPLPIVYLDHPAKPCFSRWRFTEEERKAIAEGADIVFCQCIFGSQFNPVHFQVCMPDEQPDLLGG